ncbi:hypothetical protein ACFFX0_14765 [Citricoccus parietis]|uniref:Uncharacterized protein n=1 Tax=Citricoccus parietis TaxID=592307 RepID=A0ABV5G1L3_9MICC
MRRTPIIPRESLHCRHSSGRRSNGGPVHILLTSAPGCQRFQWRRTQCGDDPRPSCGRFRASPRPRRTAPKHRHDSHHRPSRRQPGRSGQLRSTP